MKLTKAERLFKKELMKRTKGMKIEEAVAYITKTSIDFLIWKEMQDTIKEYRKDEENVK